MAQINFGGVNETVVTREEFPLEKARKVLENETIAVIGYGVQGPGQSLNLRDNGFNVIVGQREGTRSWERAVADGWVPGQTLFGIEEAAERGTIIQERVESSEDDPVITGIAGKKDFTSINIHKDLMNSQIGFCRDVLNVLSEHQIPLEHMPSSIDSMTVIVDSAHLNGLEEEIRTEIIKAVQPDSIETEDGIALIAVVGRGMCRTRGVAARIFAALAHAHINVRMIDQGSSELNVIVAVKETDFEQAIRCIYDMFVNSVA